METDSINGNSLAVTKLSDTTMKIYTNGFDEIRQLDTTNGNLFDFSEVIDTTVRDYTIEIDENNITDEVRHFDFSRGKC